MSEIEEMVLRVESSTRDGTPGAVLPPTLSWLLLPASSSKLAQSKEEEESFCMANEEKTRINKSLLEKGFHFPLFTFERDLFSLVSTCTISAVTFLILRSLLSLP